MTARRLVIAAIAILAAPMVLASFSGTDVFLPSVGRAPGAAGSQWYTTVWVHNPGLSTANVQFFLLERDRSNPSPLVYNDTVPAGDTKRYDNAIGVMFAVEKFGALRVVSSSPVIVNGRIYSMSTGGELKDSVGQFFSGIPSGFAIGSSQKTQILGVYQTSPKPDSQFRYNFGFVESAGGTATVRVHVMDETGAELTSRDYTLAAYEVRQYAIENAYAGVNHTNLRLEMEVISGSGKVVAFGSGLANRGNDPSTFEMSFRDELLGGAASTVSHDGTLTGDGSVGSPLGVANGGISKQKLSAGGGAAGQVLGTDGSNLVWQAGGGLTLPYNGPASTGSMAFSITNSAGPAVQGWSSTHDGVTGLSNGAGRSGVYGKSDQANGFGVYGENSTASGIGWGMYGKVTSATGVGVGGWASSTTGLTVGMWGQTESTADLSTGVVGLARGTTGKTYGVWGNAPSNQGYGVYGQNGQSATSDTNHRGGVWGDSLDGQGVLGTSKNSVGVAGISLGKNAVQGIASTGGNSGVGVLGFATNGADWGGRFTGNVSVSGTLSKGAGSFLIDHPLDPAGKYLYHSFVESPDMMNIYNGNVTTDASGEATVTMPDYFSALNRDFRYQLTVIGTFAQAIVAREIENDQFTIRTDKPNVKVSWQVTGIRQDAFANAHRIPVEVVKPAEEQGTFLHPAELGQPADANVLWVQQPELMSTVKQIEEKQ